MAKVEGKRRTHEAREVRLVSEFMASQYPTARVFNLQRVGAIQTPLDASKLTEAELRVIGNKRRQADGIVVQSNKLILIEGYILPDPGKISQLLLYSRLVPQTPELSTFSKFPVEMLLVGPIEDPPLTKLAAELGIKFTLYRPSWVVEHLLSLDERKRRNLELLTGQNR